jgi:hypothetical protein
MAEIFFDIITVIGRVILGVFRFLFEILIEVFLQVIIDGIVYLIKKIYAYFKKKEEK